MKTTMHESVPNDRKAKAIHKTKQAERNAGFATLKKRATATNRARGPAQGL